MTADQLTRYALKLLEEPQAGEARKAEILAEIRKEDRNWSRHNLRSRSRPLRNRSKPL